MNHDPAHNTGTHHGGHGHDAFLHTHVDPFEVRDHISAAEMVAGMGARPSRLATWPRP